MRPVRITDVYCWILRFDTGHTFTQLENNKLPKDKRIDVNDPPKELGRPHSIVLRPVKFGLPKIERDIPEGALPVFAARTTMKGSTPTRLEFLCGHNIGGRRYYTIVDAETGKQADDVEDNDGCISVDGH